jgi:uracil-DNA glycosylase
MYNNNDLLINVKDSWKIIFENYNKNFKKNSLNNILIKLEEIENNLNEKNNIFPKPSNIFRCFNYFELHETKVVILGQDPYHGPNQATGLCFGVKKDASVPPSLRNIIKELKNDLNIDLTNTTLEDWAKQNILLLNTSLSVLQGKPNSHVNLWNDFTKYIIEELNNCEHIIFVAWGAFAYEKFKNINLNKHKLIVSSHPSPLSVYKQFKNFPAFINSKPFSKINQILEENNKKIILW